MMLKHTNERIITHTQNRCLVLYLEKSTRAALIIGICIGCKLDLTIQKIVSNVLNDIYLKQFFSRSFLFKT